MNELFFVISKLAWGILSPSNLIVILLAIATVLVSNNKILAAKWILIPLSLATVLLLAYPVSDYLMYPLEKRFSKPILLPSKIDGIIVLGGGEELKQSLSWQTQELGDGGDRYFATVSLAKKYPNVPVIFSGGNNLLTLKGEGKEGHIAYQVLTKLGIEKQRLVVETQARNTYENLVHLQSLLPKEAGKYILVTSAFHMPRAVGVARQQSVKVIPYPVDYRSNSEMLRRWDFNLYEHLQVLEPAWREWIGLTVYFFTDKTAQWLPSEVADEHK